jgi:hypothetical protein
MKEINHATKPQSEQMKELGFPQDGTDCVWVLLPAVSKNYPPSWCLVTRYDLETTYKEIVIEWYAAPNAQEIELPKLQFDVDEYEFYICANHERKVVGDIDSLCRIINAQARAAAFIWERENG